MVVATMAASKATISMKAAPGMWKPKNSHDHAAFKANWTANRASGHQCHSPAFRHTSQAATAMQI